MSNITVICAWCGKIIYKSYNVFDDFISHGICSICRDKIKKDYLSVGKEPTLSCEPDKKNIL